MKKKKNKRIDMIDKIVKAHVEEIVEHIFNMIQKEIELTKFIRLTRPRRYLVGHEGEFYRKDLVDDFIESLNVKIGENVDENIKDMKEFAKEKKK